MSALPYFDLPYELRQLIGIYTGQAYVSEKEQLLYVDHQHLLMHIKQIVQDNNCHLLVMYIQYLPQLCLTQLVPIIRLLVKLDNYSAFEIAYTELNKLTIEEESVDICAFVANRDWRTFQENDTPNLDLLLDHCIQNSKFFQLLVSNINDNFHWSVFKIAQKHDKVIYMQYLPNFNFITFVDSVHRSCLDTKSFKILYNLYPVDISLISIYNLLYLNNIEIIKFFIDSAFKVNTKCMVYAVEHNNMPALALFDSLLEEKSLAILDTAALLGIIDTIQFLIDKQYPMSKYILCQVAFRCDIIDRGEIIKILVEAGCYTGPEIIQHLLTRKRTKYIPLYIQYGCAIPDNYIYQAIDTENFLSFDLFASNPSREPAVIDYILNNENIAIKTKISYLRLAFQADYPISDKTLRAILYDNLYDSRLQDVIIEYIHI